jgi:predicted ATPase
MIKSVTFKKDFRCFKQGECFEFKPGVNVLVGDQGCGKSTLIELIRSVMEPKFKDSDSSYRAKTISASEKVTDIVKLKHTCQGDYSVVSFDFERESARDTSAIHFDMIEQQLAAMRSSHGQGNLISLGSLMDKVKSQLHLIDTVMLDEPDAALSPRSCYGLLGIINGIGNRWKKQVIVSAHNPIIISGKIPFDKSILWNEVLSLEDKRWIPGDIFLALQALPAVKHEKEETKV